MDFKFCPKCGANYKPNSAEKNDRLTCLSCGFIFYQNSKPTSSALIVNDKKQILLLRRAIDPKKGCWDIPGGFLKNGEDPKSGLSRELREELDVNSEIGDIFGIYIDKYLFQDTEHYTFNVYYHTLIGEEKIKLSKENSEYKWFGIEDIPFDEMAFEQHNIVVNDFLGR